MGVLWCGDVVVWGCLGVGVLSFGNVVWDCLGVMVCGVGVLWCGCVWYSQCFVVCQ